MLRGRRATGHWVIRPDIEGAGATWVDEAVVVDGPLITSRFPDDLGPFCRAIREAVAARL
jgi:protease I